MDYEYTQYKEANYNLNVLANSKNMFIILMNFSKLLMKMTDDNKKRFLENLEKAKDRE